MNTGIPCDRRGKWSGLPGALQHRGRPLRPAFLVRHRDPAMAAICVEVRWVRRQSVRRVWVEPSWGNGFELPLGATFDDGVARARELLALWCRVAYDPSDECEARVVPCARVLVGDGF
jgi:hypothetical protein